MLDFIRKSFRTLFEIFLWINLIVMTIGGGAIGFILSSQHTRSLIRESVLIVGASASSAVPLIITVIFSLIGFGLGFFIGIFTNIIGGGIFSYLIAINQSLENNEKYLKFLAVDKKKSETQKEPDLTPA